jgi:hypothetical protein
MVAIKVQCTFNVLASVFRFSIGSASGEASDQSWKPHQLEYPTQLACLNESNSLSICQYTPEYYFQGHWFFVQEDYGKKEELPGLC